MFDLKYPLRTLVDFQVVGDVVADGLERGGLDEEDDGLAKLRVGYGGDGIGHGNDGAQFLLERLSLYFDAAGVDGVVPTTKDAETSVGP